MSTTQQAEGVWTDVEVRLALLASSRRWRFRYDVVDQAGAVKANLEVAEARVANNDLADKAHRTCDLAVRPGQDHLIDLGKDRVRVFALLQMRSALGVTGWFEWALGTFHLETGGASWGGPATPAQRTGFDSLKVLAEDAVLDRYVVPSGDAVWTAVGQVLADGGFATHQVSWASALLPAAMEWPPGTSRLTIVNDLLAAMGYRSLFMDPWGQPTSHPYQVPADAPTTWEYRMDRASVVLPGVDTDLDLSEVPNTWLGLVSEPDRPELVSVYVNDDPASPTSTVSRGRTIVQVVDGPQGTTDSEGNTLAVDQATLDAHVRRYALEASQQFEHLEFSTGLMPVHGSGDVFLVDYGAGPQRWKETEWTAELRPGGAMQHKMRRVVEV